MDKPEKRISKWWAIPVGLVGVAAIAGLVALRMADIHGNISLLCRLPFGTSIGGLFYLFNQK